MNFIHTPEKIHTYLKPRSQVLIKLKASLALAPCEIESPIICAHFRLPSKQKIARQIEAETLRLQKRGYANG